MEMTSPDRAVLVTGSDEVRERVLAAAAATAKQVRVCREAAELAAGPPPRTVLVGADQVALVARSPLVGRVAIHLVGTTGDQARLCEWSAALGAPVIVLPEGVRWLAAALAGPGDGGAGRVVGVIGGSGGLGTSTFAAGLASTAAERGLRSVLVDLDGRGGGADLLFGLERAPGWRWPALMAADGFLGDLHDHLPHTEGLAVVSHDRGEAVLVAPAAITAVLRSVTRSHDFVVLDAGSRPGAAEAAALGSADGALLVCSPEVRGLAAARQQLRALDAHLPLGVVLSRLRGGGEGRAVVERTLGLGVVATVPADRGIAGGADRGQPPGRVAGRAWRRTCAAVVDGLLAEVRGDQ